MESPSNGPPKLPPRDSRFVAGLRRESRRRPIVGIGPVSTALPTIVQHLHGQEFIWVGSAYAIASTAILPTVGGLVTVFGRKPILICFIFAFALGSAAWAAAGCIAVTEIIYADLVPLPERGKFQGITALVWALACGMGPPVGGALANSDAWRWIFYLNLPLCGLAILLVTLFLTVHTPRKGFTEQILKTDWLGLFLIISGTVAIMIGLTWGGINFPWVSPQVLVPICVGGILEHFFHGIVSMTLSLASPIGSGVDLFGLALTIALFAIFTGLSVQILKRYRPQNYIGWVLNIVGFALLSTLSADSAKGKYIAYEAAPSSKPPELPLAHGLGRRHCDEPRAHIRAHPTIRGLPGPLQAEVRALFAAGLVLVWRVMIGLCGIGLLTCLLMKEVPMRTALDGAWGLRDVDEKAGDREMPGEGKEDAPIDIGVSIA
ncbi:iron permease [Pholiota molesta]|nr:iron permease [Pholiota molesta]